MGVWFGWTAAESKAVAPSTAAADAVLELTAPLATIYVGQRVPVVIGTFVGDGPVKSVEGRRARLEVHRDVRAPRDVTWPVSAPPKSVAREPWSRLDVVLIGRATRRWSLFVLRDRAYRLTDIQRALAHAVDSGRSALGWTPVLVTDESRRAEVRGGRPPANLESCGIFRCDNPMCAARGVERLVPFSVSPELARFESALGQPLALPCPSCPGAEHEIWALTFVSRASARTLPHTRPWIDFPSRPTQRRLTRIAGPMSVVAGVWPVVTWGSEWGVEGLRAIPRIATSAALRRPIGFIRAMRRSPVAMGALASWLLTADNVRALVEHVRSRPASERLDGLALAMSHLYAGRRSSNYRTKDVSGEITSGHFHYIAADPQGFVERLAWLGALDHRGRFLDVGSGTGEKLFLAYACGRFSACDGIEYQPDTAAVARYLLNTITGLEPYPINTTVADATTFTGYGAYDFIWLYRPLRARGAMMSLLRWIATQLAPGAVVHDFYDTKLAFRRTATGYETPAEPPGGGPTRWVEAPLDAILADD